MTNVLTIDDDLRDALEWAIGLALGDQEHYLKFGNPEVDYDDEWPRVAMERAATLDRLAMVCLQMGSDGIAKSCKSLAAQFKETIEIETPKKKRGKKNGK